MAERDSDQAGSRTGAGASAVIAPILSASPAVIMGFVPTCHGESARVPCDDPMINAVVRRS
jgi:hypothetical protein